jgi:hypothetical protein
MLKRKNTVTIGDWEKAEGIYILNGFLRSPCSRQEPDKVYLCYCVAGKNRIKFAFATA